MYKIATMNNSNEQKKNTAERKMYAILCPVLISQSRNLLKWVYMPDVVSSFRLLFCLIFFTRR